METFNVFELIGAITLVQILLYIGYLSTTEKGQSKFLLITFLSVMAVLLINLFLKSHWKRTIPYFYFEYIALLAPLLYLYCKSLTRQEFRIGTRSLYHFAPFLFIMVVHISAIQGYIFSVTLFEKHLAVPLFAFAFYYLYLTLKQIKHYHQIIQMISSSFDLHNLKWLRLELCILAAFFASLGAESLSLFFDLSGYYFTIVLISFLSLLLFINILSFKSLRLPFQTAKNVSESLVFLKAKDSKYLGSSLSVVESEKHFDRLKIVLDEKKPYKAYRLSLHELSDIAGLSPTELSQVINENSKMNFNDFINSYRIEEAKALMKTHPDWLIKEVMYESGFQSTSTFNSAFKKLNKKSPSAFRKGL